MPHTLIKPTVIAPRALATLFNTIVLAGLVSRDYDDAFSGVKGDTVNVRTPTTFEAKEFDRDDGIELQDATESSFPVVLDTITDVSFPVTAEDLTLNIENFDEQFLVPAMEAIAQDLDGRLAEEAIDTARGVGGGGAVTGDPEPYDAYRKGRTKLSRAKMPLTERYGVLSPEGVGEVLGDDRIVKVNESGSTDALRNAVVGRINGIENYETQTLGDPEATGDHADAHGVAFHRSALVLAMRTLERPDGVAAEQAAVESYRGLGLRVVKDYDINKKQDVVSVDALLGTKAVPSRKAGVVELDLGLSS